MASGGIGFYVKLVFLASKLRPKRKKKAHICMLLGKTHRWSFYSGGRTNT
jgi:hypothetical protein